MTTGIILATKQAKHGSGLIVPHSKGRFISKMECSGYIATITSLRWLLPPYLLLELLVSLDILVKQIIAFYYSLQGVSDFQAV